MFETIRRRIAPEDLKQKEMELRNLKREMRELATWCGHDSPEIGFAIRHLENKQENIGYFRDNLRQGKFTQEAYMSVLAHQQQEQNCFGD